MKKYKKKLLIKHCNPTRKQQNNHDGFIQILAADVIIVRQRTLEKNPFPKHSVDCLGQTTFHSYNIKAKE